MFRSGATSGTRIHRRSKVTDAVATFLILLLVPPFVSLVPVVGGLTPGYLFAGGLGGYFVHRVRFAFPLLLVTTMVHVVAVRAFAEWRESVIPPAGRLLAAIWMALVVAGAVGLVAGAKVGSER